MAQWTVEKAHKLFQREASERLLMDDLYRDAMELTFPDREFFYKRAPGQKRAGRLWDSTAMVSVIRKANRLSSEFTPAFQPFIEIGLGPAAKHMDDAEFQDLTGKSKEQTSRELEAATEVVQAVLHTASFAKASNEFYIDYQYGMATMFVEENSDPTGPPVMFDPVPLPSHTIREGARKEVDQWFFWREVPANVIEQEWPDADMSAELKEMAAADKPKPVKLHITVYLDPDEKDEPFRYEVFRFHGKSAGERIVARQYRTPAFATARHTVLPGEHRGRGPVLFAVPDIATANKIVELTLRSAALAVGGIWTSADDALNSKNITLAPNSIINVRSNGGAGQAPTLQRLDTPANITFGEVLLEKLHENIKKILGDNSLPPEAGPIRTATEFVQRLQELITDEAGGLARLHSEFIIPVAQRIIDILERRGVFPFQGLKIDQFFIQLRMTSVIARNQQLEEVQSIVRFLELLGLLGGDEMKGLIVKVEDAAISIGEALNVPSKLINNEAEREEIKAKVAEAIQAQQQAQQPEAEGLADQAEAAA